MVPPQPKVPAVRHLATLVVVTVMSLLGAPARAQSVQPALPCHDHDEIARQLRDRYDETPVSLGLQGNGNLLQVYSSIRTGTWTVVSTMPSGIACILAAGDGWQQRTVGTADPAA